MHRPLSIRIKVVISWAIYLPIVGITYLGVWLDRMLKFPMPFPRNVDQLAQRTDWLIAELKKNGALPAHAQIDSCVVTALDQTAIFRSNAGTVAITYTDGNEKKTLRCFAKFAPMMGTIWNRTIFNLQLNHLKEAWFNLHFADQDRELPAPRVYCSKVSIMTGNLCLITELMSDNMEYRECAYDHLTQQHLDMALEGLAALHARYWGEASTRMKYVLPIEDATVYMFEALVARSWSPAAREVMVRSWTTMNKPQTILHGDSRIGNMMFPAGEGRGRYVLIDWQATRRGTAAFDLAYFLMLSLISHQREAVEQASVDSYYSHLIAKGVKNYSREQLEEDYRHGLLCTLVLLSLPLLSGEVSVEGFAAQVFVYGMDVWRQRMKMRFESFDYVWMADRYGMTEQECRAAVSEMLTVIEKRLDGISQVSGSQQAFKETLRSNNVRSDFDV